MERLQGIELFPHAEKLNRLAGHGPDRQHGATTRIALDFRQDDTGEADLLIELTGHIHRILAGHGIGNQQHFVGAHSLLDRHEFGHQLIIDMQPAAGIEHNQIVALLLTAFHPALADTHHIGA